MEAKITKVEAELAARKFGLQVSIARITHSLERARAVKVALKAQDEQVDEIIASLVESKAIDKSKVEEEVARLRKEAATPEGSSST